MITRRSPLPADDSGDRPGYVREWYIFYHKAGGIYSSVAKYIARLHRYDKLFNTAKRLPGSDSKTAAIMEVSKLMSFCVYL